MESGPPCAKLVVVWPEHDTRELEIRDSLTIGRSSKNDLVIDNLDCSRAHAVIRRLDDGRFGLFDLGSRNGSFLNGTRIETPQPLRDTDRIDIADIVLRFELANAASAQSSAEPGTVPAASPRPPEDFALAVVLVSDIVGYQVLAQRLAPALLREFAAEWFGALASAVEENGGSVDRMTGESLLGYWLVKEPAEATREVDGALQAAQAAAWLQDAYGASFRERFQQATFAIGMGVHLGQVRLGNAGCTQDQVCTLQGDSVVVAVGLEGLAEERGLATVVSDAIARAASPHFRFQPLEGAAVRDGSRPIQALALTPAPLGA